MSVQSSPNTILSIALEEHLLKNDAKAALSAISNTTLSESLTHSCADEMVVLRKFLTDDVFVKDPKFYYQCEEVLKAICEKSGEDEVLFEMLDIIESTKSDNTFISALKGLQISLINQKTSRSRSWEWCLESIYTYVEELPLPRRIRYKLEEDEAYLIENNEHVERLLMIQMTLTFFLEAVIKSVKKTPTIIDPPSPFWNTENTRENILASFILKLMGPQFCFVEILDSTIVGGGRPYTRQCAISLVSLFSMLVPDPYILLQINEERIIKSMMRDDGLDDEAEELDNLKKINIFRSRKTVPILSIAVYFYYLYGEGLLPADAPKLYTNFYLTKYLFHLVTILLNRMEGSLNQKGIKFGDSLIDLLETDKLWNCPNYNFIQSLGKIIIFSDVERNRKNGVALLKRYILKFNLSHRVRVIKAIIEDEPLRQLHGYVAIMYKNMIGEHMNSGESLPLEFCGDEFQTVILDYVCNLKNGATTDLMENSDLIISALNIIRYFTIRDTENLTSIWTIISEIRVRFLSPLRMALDLSKAHYRAEEIKVNTGESDELFEKLDFNLLDGNELPKLTKEEKLGSLASAFNTFDVMESLLARVIECTSVRTAIKGDVGTAVIGDC